MTRVGAVLPWLSTLCITCAHSSSRSHPPLAAYSNLTCSSLLADYGDDLNRAAASDAPTALDPTLGWNAKLGDFQGMCVVPSPEDAEYCRGLRRYAMRYTAFQERPLDLLGAEEVFRALYDHSLGAAVLVRAARFNGESHLVAKVLQRGPGPLAWITSRRLSDADWLALKRAAARLPNGTAEYYPRFSRVPGSGAVCETMDGAGVQIELLQGGTLRILRGAYEPSSSQRCSGPCCGSDHQAEAISRFFDHLVGLVGCAQSAALGIQDRRPGPPTFPLKK